MNFDLNKADKIPALMFTDITENPDAETAPDETNQGETSASNSDRLNIGFKAENTHAFSTPDNPTTRNDTGAGMFNPTQNQGVKLGGAIGGKTATDIVNILLPSLAVWGMSAAGYHFDKKMIELTAEEKKIIAPAMQDYLNSINVNFDNPLSNLLFVVGSIYTAKIIEVVPQMQKKAPRPQGIKVDGPGKVRTAPKSAVDALIAKTAATRKQSKAKAAQFLLNEGQIIRTSDGYKMA